MQRLQRQNAYGQKAQDGRVGVLRLHCEFYYIWQTAAVAAAATAVAAAVAARTMLTIPISNVCCLSSSRLQSNTQGLHLLLLRHSACQQQKQQTLNERFLPLTQRAATAATAATAAAASVHTCIYIPLVLSAWNEQDAA
jgi:hypothetical protein